MSGSTGEAAVADGTDTARALEPAPSRGARIRAWFAALLRSVTALVVTLAVLAALAGVTDVVLHVTRHTNTTTNSYSGINTVHVVLDGDISLNVVGRKSGASGVSVSTTSTNTPFDDAVQTEDVVGGNLYLTERCPDSRCVAQMTLTLSAQDQVSITAGNALRLDDSVIELNGIEGNVSVLAAPAKVVVAKTVATGAVVGVLQCDTAADCQGVQTASHGSGGSGSLGN